jgi:four helix bundle protein
MSTVKRFTELKAWQNARILTREVYSHSNQGAFARDFALRDQIRRAAISIQSNIAEGFERGGNKEFLQFLSIAIGSAGELESQLYTALDLNYLSNEKFDALLNLLNNTRKPCMALLNYLRTVRDRGAKFNSNPKKPQ